MTLTLDQLSERIRLLYVKASLAKMNTCHSQADGKFCSGGSSKGGGASASTSLEDKAKQMAREHEERKATPKFPSPSFGNAPAPTYLKNLWQQAQNEKDHGASKVAALAAKMSDSQLGKVLTDLNKYRHTKDPFIQHLSAAIGKEVNSRGGIKS